MPEEALGYYKAEIDSSLSSLACLLRKSQYHQINKATLARDLAFDIRLSVMTNLNIMYHNPQSHLHHSHIVSLNVQIGRVFIVPLLS